MRELQKIVQVSGAAYQTITVWFTKMCHGQAGARLNFPARAWKRVHGQAGARPNLPAGAGKRVHGQADARPNFPAGLENYV